MSSVVHPELSTEEIAKRAVRHLRHARDEEDRAKRARFMRHAADLLVELRSRHSNSAGEPDWAGRSWEYRQLVQDIYSEAGLPHDGQDSLKSVIRYHIGNALRDRLDQESLVSAGLKQAAPRERGFMAGKQEEGEDNDELIRDTIAEIARLTNRLVLLGQPSKPPRMSDMTRVRNALRGLRSWFTVANAARSVEAMQPLRDMTPESSRMVAEWVVRLLGHSDELPGVIEEEFPVQSAQHKDVKRAIERRRKNSPPPS